MEKIDLLQQQLFQECMEVLQHLATSQSKEELVSRQNLLLDVSEHISFIKLLDQHRENLILETPLQVIDGEDLRTQDNVSESQGFIKETFSEPEEPAETILDKSEELPLIITNPDIASLETNDAEENKESFTSEPAIEVYKEEVINEVVEEPQPEIIQEEVEEELVAESTLNEESYERAVEFKEQEIENLQENKQDKKFKIANIKGLNKIESLFDEPQPAESFGEISRSDTPSDFMEGEKSRPDFKLDLNDRIAFTQNLFGGSQTELNETIHNLNSFKTLDEVKEYLSDVYYQRNWKKVDDYAQRLWTLVENKFL